MKRIITTVAALAFSAAFAISADAEKKKADPEAAWAKISGGKESITKEEYMAKAKDDAAKTKMEASFKAKDKDGDGKLTKAEFTAKGGKKK